MTLAESFDEFIPARDRGLEAITAINSAMATWNRRVDEIKALAGTQHWSREQYWTEQAAALDNFARTLGKGTKGLAEATETLLYVIDARVFWHDQKDVAKDLLTEESLEVFGALKKITASNRSGLVRNKELAKKSAGEHELMRTAVERWTVVTDGLIEQYVLLEGLAVEVLRFRRYRVGLYGVLRSTAAKVKRLIARRR